MRRLSAAGAAIVLCLALGGAQVAAQGTDLEGATVTATQDCPNLAASPIGCSWTASDARLTGTLTHDQVGEIWDPEPEPANAAGFSWLDGTLEGPEGS